MHFSPLAQYQVLYYVLEFSGVPFILHLGLTCYPLIPARKLKRKWF